MTNNKQQTEVNKEFIPYELALELKQLGFDEPCLASYYHAGRKLDICEYINHGEYTVLAPLFQQAFRWFREKYGLNSFVYHYGEDGILHIIYFAYNINDNLYASDFRTYEYTELACLKKLIEIANDKQ